MGLTNFPNGITAYGVPLFPDVRLAGVKNVYFVDGDNGSDDNTGEGGWDNATLTMADAIALSNATIDWSATPKRYNVIYVAPGVYAENLTFPYYCFIIGTGIRGTDTATEIHPTTGSCFTGTMLGTVLWNLRLEVDEAVDCLDVGICNNSEVAFCTFTNGAAVAATGLSTDNCTHLHFHHNDVESGQLTGMNYGLYFRGGANKFAHNIRVHDNQLHCTQSGAWIQNTCTASEAEIYNNRIYCSGGASYGIDDYSGMSYCFGNWISATDAIQHPNSATHCVGNHVSDAGTGAMEVSGS